MIPPVQQTTYISQQLPKKVELIEKEKKEKPSYKGKSFKDVFKKEFDQHIFDIEA